MIIFYSWQTDSPNRINKDFIQSAAQIAIEKVYQSGVFEIHPVLDRDTQDVPGTPSIIDTILQKIEKSDLVLCDVTLVTRRDSKPSSPNPNVLVELGYAVGKLGWERLICVMNEEYGGPGKLPFDLKNRRWPLKYRLSADAIQEKYDQELQKLADSIEYAIMTTLQSGIITKRVHPKDRRFARRFKNNLLEFEHILFAYLRSCGYGLAYQILETDYIDMSGTEYPDPQIVAEIVDVFSKNTLYAHSNTRIGERVLTWAEVFVENFRILAARCVQMLDRYSERDDHLLEIVEEMERRAGELDFIIGTTTTQPVLSDLYNNGVPEAHIDWFRYFFLLMLKSRREIRRFYQLPSE